MTMSMPVRTLCLVLGLAMLAGCHGNGSSTTASSPTASVVTSSNKSTVLSVSGSPSAGATVGQSYSFTPTVSGASGNVTFSIQNAPSWLSLDIATGALSGTPQAGDAGTDSNIVLSVSDGQTSASLSPFTITVAQSGSGSGNATLTWTAPTSNTDGSALTDLAGYKIYYGTSSTALNQVVTVTSGVTSYIVEGLTSGTWYFAIRSYTSVGTESALSNVVSKTIT